MSESVNDLLIKDLINEKKSVSRNKLIFRLFILLYISITTYFILSSGVLDSKVGPSKSEPHIATVNIYGSIDTVSESSSKKIIKALNKAFENKNSKEVVLQINSPGGRPVQAAYIHDEIIKLKQIYKKPVTAIIEDSGASAAYLISVAADNIYANKSSIVGSIGVRMDSFNFKGAMDTIGVKNTTITSGNNKDMLSPFNEINPEGVKHVSGLLSSVHTHFIDYVKDGRGDRLDADNKDLFSGLFWTGEDALKLGLIDGFKSIHDLARGHDTELIVNYNTKKTLLDSFIKDISVSMSSSLVSAMSSQLHNEGLNLK